MVTLIAGILVACFGVFLVALSAAVFVKPEKATVFLESFASSAKSHYFEQLIRLIAGWSLIVYAPQMCFVGAFSLLGWTIVVTTIGLLLIPWRWHGRFANLVVPVVTRFLNVYGVLSLALGGIVLYAIFCGVTR